MTDIGTLIVDDQRDIRLLVRLLIEAHNNGLFVTGEAASGEEALGRLDADDPVVIVIDEMMPGMNGLETVEEIRARRPRQAIILFSAYLDEKLIERARNAGVELCLPKEDIRMLPEVIQRLAGHPV